MGAPTLGLCSYHLGPWFMHTICACGLALWFAWVGPHAIKPLMQQPQAFIHLCCR
jgi:hypothetical protein